MTIKRLVHMANQVASFFGSYSEAEAIAGTFNHLKSFWDPRMRREILHWVDENQGDGLSALVLEAIRTRRSTLQPASGETPAR